MKFIFSLLVLLLFSCEPSPSEVKFEIKEKAVLKEITGASGVVRREDSYYVIGDNSPYLVKIDEQLRFVSKYQIHDIPEEMKNGRIAKEDKPDYEALELIGEEELIAFGSGSKSPERDVFLKIQVKDSLSVQKHSLTGFYSELKNREVLRGSELNIEAAAYSAGNLYLFNRGKNVIFTLDYQAFLDFLKNVSPLPEITTSGYDLPEMRKVKAGFSGATIDRENGNVLITASVESTGNAYEDGAILGSFVGVVPLKDGRVGEIINWTAIDHPEKPLKVESITIETVRAPNDLDVVLVTDSDGDESLILKGNLKW